jgi:bifunctional non-homologous end joining protein LigD
MNKNGLFRFVVQKHKATALHYDFRLEIGELMPSWAVPKGPTLDSTVRRLAMRTPDHDIEWSDFEGIIPERSVGAGPVMIWDEGMFNPEIEISKGIREEIFEREHGERVLMEGLEKGELKFVLYGEKLKGSFALVKTKMFGPPSRKATVGKGSQRESWLMIKHKDDFVEVGYEAKMFDESVRSKRSFDEIAAEGSS